MRPGLAGRLEGEPDHRPPLILLHGLTFDQTIEYLNWLNYVLPQAGATVWPGSGHFPHLAHPARFAGCLAATARPAAWRPGRGGNAGPNESFGADLRLPG